MGHFAGIFSMEEPTKDSAPRHSRWNANASIGSEFFGATIYP